MAEEPRRENEEREPERRGDRPALTRRDTWHLVWSTYKASFPYLLIFVVGMLTATWLVTTVFFR
jgi:hypothetical protein